jgi:hypothetical protein
MLMLLYRTERRSPGCLRLPKSIEIYAVCIIVKVACVSSGATAPGSVITYGLKAQVFTQSR